MSSSTTLNRSLVGPEVFDEDYVYFYEEVLAGRRRERDVRLVTDLLSLAPGSRLLDLACGYGRLSNPLAKAGYEVVGCDVSEAFLRLARTDAEREGLTIEYWQKDMRTLDGSGDFDAVICWFTSFGYFDDPENLRVLSLIRTALKPGGKLLLDLNNRDALVGQLRSAPEHVSVLERGEDILVDRVRFNQKTGRSETARMISRAGRLRRIEFSIRMPTLTEIAGWLSGVGFDRVDAYNELGEEFSTSARRLIVLARRP